MRLRKMDNITPNTVIYAGAAVAAFGAIIVVVGLFWAGTIGWYLTKAHTYIFLGSVMAIIATVIAANQTFKHDSKVELHNEEVAERLESALEKIDKTVGNLVGGDSVVRIVGLGWIKPGHSIHGSPIYVNSVDGEFPLFNVIFNIEESWYPVRGEDVPRGYIPSKLRQRVFSTTVEKVYPHADATVTIDGGELLYPDSPKRLYTIRFTFNDGLNLTQYISLQQYSYITERGVVDTNWQESTIIYDKDGNEVFSEGEANWIDQESFNIEKKHGNPKFPGVSFSNNNGYYKNAVWPETLKLGANVATATNYTKDKVKNGFKTIWK